ncbi:MAG TPA: UBP-type zinc finger domain-containing protein [Thermoanaerobaculia bacterium]|nr:UBP-type zinc finger domain-containing protein [Thermoanaerobaculia bacterium]HXT50984.1 UBP-type zinc finger domain-containing protein [Thermoanaerobaculia bacterium]
MATCSHLETIHYSTPTSGRRVCEDCVKIGGSWVHLRMCLECGHVGCCDSSPNRHATRHFHDTRHALVRSIEPGERWIWCYVDELMPGELPD